MDFYDTKSMSIVKDRLISFNYSSLSKPIQMDFD